MYICYKTFDDNYIEVLDLNSYQTAVMSASDIKKFIHSGHNIFGVTCSDNKITAVRSYECISFPSEMEADEYLKDNNISYKDKLFVNGYWYVFEKRKKVIHVRYYIYNYNEYETTYVGLNRSYTPYKDAAKEFEKKEAFVKAASMNKNGNGSKRWLVLREPVA